MSFRHNDLTDRIDSLLEDDAKKFVFGIVPFVYGGLPYGELALLGDNLCCFGGGYGLTVE